MRVAHYVNQFFAGVGGEEAAGMPPEMRAGAVGPGRRLASLLGPGHEVVATVLCGDDHAASSADIGERVLALLEEARPELLVAGPAFGSGRYGIACARVAAAAARAGIPAVAAMHPDNPGVAEAAPAAVVATGPTARDMGEALTRLAGAVHALAAGEELSAEHGLVTPAGRRNTLAGADAATRAVDLVLARLGGDRTATEIPEMGAAALTPASPVSDCGQAVVALLTESALVPEGNPDRLESSRARRWLRYAIAGRDALPPGEWLSVHGGFATVAANADPHRLVPLDVSRELEREGRIGRLHGEYLVTVGNGTAVSDAERFGVEWAAELRRAGVQATILTAT